MHLTSFIFLICAALITSVLCELDYYKVLGLSKGSGEKEIKSAYRQLSKKYHPDKNPGDEDAHHKFIEVGEAYEVLGDESKRKLYDQYGHEGVKQGGNPRGGNPFGGGGFDPFASFFGGGQRQRQGRPKGHTSDVRVDITLEDFYLGSDLQFDVEMQDICPHCDGTGSKDKETHTCSGCQGSGMKIMKRQLAPGMFQQFQTTCNECGGKGKTIKNKCSHCQGEAVHRNARHFEFYMEPGTAKSHIHIFKGEGDHSPDWDSGDLQAHLEESSVRNLGYRRRFDTLYRTEALTLKEALLGDWKRDIPFFGDDSVTITRNKGEIVMDGDVQVIKGKGMPILDGPEEFGDLIIEYKIIFPGGAKNYKDSKLIRDEL
ncbi:Chaperone protein [Wickerhamomyces ciferrii]|uniref:Chaperone protein n=1 Tax=Wickerhamomyces ciferrii (strain ATCC 14091 / BCRC 22168 / CBS 111 / JCM 3599 / NBRC 0793 / NRRL Y-1031 F-60-10) TaxID=1206466 RepID=K0KHY3_WICCF|nr:Chaperone protein [Wickerhamomyces ciferrii]CCH41019.1 Chaperone protein [Wickerhamomyces ciferrii]